jgi:hypothetical protein
MQISEENHYYAIKSLYVAGRSRFKRRMLRASYRIKLSL